MTVTDEAKLIAIRQQLLEMRYKLDASINIINYVFDQPNTSDKSVSRFDVRSDFNSCNIVEPGGQDSIFVEEEDEEECEA